MRFGCSALSFLRFQEVFDHMMSPRRLREALFTLSVSTALIVTTPPAFADVSDGLAALDAGDIASAASRFQDGFAAGDADGAFYLGRLFEFGLGTDADITRAVSTAE